MKKINLLLSSIVIATFSVAQTPIKDSCLHIKADVVILESHSVWICSEITDEPNLGVASNSANLTLKAKTIEFGGGESFFLNSRAEKLTVYKPTKNCPNQNPTMVTICQ